MLGFTRVSLRAYEPTGDDDDEQSLIISYLIIAH